MTTLVSQEPGLATIPESPTGENHVLPRHPSAAAAATRLSGRNGVHGTMAQYTGNGPTTNGYSGQNSPSSSGHLSAEGSGGGPDGPTLISRTQKQHTTQQVTTTTKTIREIQYLGPDGQPLDYVPNAANTTGNGPPQVHPRLHGNQNYEQMGEPVYGGNGVNNQSHYHNQGVYPSQSSGDNTGGVPFNQDGGNYPPGANAYAEYPHRPPTPPSPSDRSNSPPPQHREPDYMRQAGSGNAGGGPRSGYDELDTTLMPPRPGEHYGRGGSGASPANAGGSTSSGGGVGPGVPQHAPHYPGGGPAGGYNNPYGSVSESNGGMGIADESIGYDPNNSVFEADLGGHYNNVPNSMINNATPVNTNNPVVMMQMTTPLPQSSGQGNGTFINGAPRAAFEEEEQRQLGLMQHGVGDQPPIMQRPKSSMSGQQSRGVPGVHWRDPDLHEVIEFLQNPNSVIKANAAAYLQHLCYMDDPVKAKTRQLGGIPPLVGLLSNEIPEIHRNSCGALRNLSYGRQNDENKRAIKNAGGITALVRLLRKTTDNEVKELVTGVLWNLSSCDDLKRAIIDEALLVLINIVIIPHSGWDPNGQGSGGETHWTTVFRNSSGILRNISSAGDYGRKKLRECEGLVDSVLYLVKKAIEKANIDNKSVENCVCVLRNLSYRAQEVDDPNYDKHMGLPPGETRAGAKPHSDNLGCFGASSSSKNTGSGKGGSSGRKDSQATSNNHGPGSSSRPTRTGPVKGMELLWQPEVVQPYLNLLSNCSNPETLEAAAGAIQNLSACYWQASIDVRAAVRKEKGLPILVELLRMEVDRVVCAVATALRNLAIDQRNKELVGKYAMRDLVQKLPSVSPQHDHGTSDDTIAAVLATLNEVIKKHPEFSRSLLEAGGVDRLMTITRQRQRFTPRVVKFASQVLYSMWVHQDLRETYRKAGWKEADFVTKTVAARNARPNSPTNLNSTLNRPMASQSGTRYEDRTMQRPGGTGGQTSSSGSSHHHMNNSGGGYSVRPEEVPMENLSLYSGGQQRNYAPNHIVRPGEPVYAQVNRDRKNKNGGPGRSNNHVQDHQSQTHQQMLQQQQHHQQQLANAGYNPVSNYSDHADHWQVMAAQQVAGNGSANIVDGNVGSSAGQGGQAGDSWV